MSPPVSRVYRVNALPPAATVSMGWLLRFARRIRVQLGGAIALSVLAPAVVRWSATNTGLLDMFNSSLGYAFLGTFIAVTIGYVLLRQFITFPGVIATTYILPSFAVAYAPIVFAFFFLRLDYSRLQFVASFILAVVWFYIIYSLMSRYAQPRLGLIPGGDDRNLSQLDGAVWIRLSEPPLTVEEIDGFVADLKSALEPSWERFIARMVLSGWPVYDVKQVAESLTGRVEIEHLSENSFGSVLPSLIYLRLKRLADFTLAVIALPIGLLIVALAAVCIVLESPGSPIFRQPRMGFRGKKFTCYKLRSMRIGVPGLKFTTKNDPRITRVGKFIRKYRIDELPQIFNILKGEMSWIGPRPEAGDLAEWYEREVPFYAYRHAVRPGLTGWAQVHLGNVAEVDAATTKLHYDFYYIKHFSLWLDALVLAKTVRTVLVGFERQ